MDTVQVYVDETGGSDATGTGSVDQPYQSLAYALFARGTSASSAQLLIRKDPNGTYDEPTQSALKKAKKGADGIEKKKKKAEELAEREAKEKKERERVLEESKKLVLVEDETLEKPVSVGAITIFSCSILLIVRFLATGKDRTAERAPVA